jgi:hypothetical protein
LTDTVLEVAAAFRTGATCVAAAPLGSGHINDTFLVSTWPSGAPDFVAQRINHHVFPDIAALTGNILLTTRHLQRRITEGNPAFNHFRVLQPISTLQGPFFHQHPDGSFWRMFHHIGGSKSFDQVPGPSYAFEAGRAYGLFQFLTADLDSSSLHEILPGFHDIRKRFGNFRQVVKADRAERVSCAAQEILFAETRAPEMERILQAGLEGRIPLRVTHNDTKINNVLFDPMGKAIAVIDLDTVMPGYSLYDFGDAIRTGCNKAAEDEADLSLPGIDLSLFEAYSTGYLSVAGQFLTAQERGMMVYAARFMTFIIGLRFLTDHLDGDQYFHIRFPGHNLQRARAQFRLLEDMENQSEEMETIIRTIHT